MEVFEIVDAPCSSIPEFILDTPQSDDCVGVDVGDEWNEDIVAYGGGDAVGCAN